MEPLDWSHTPCRDVGGKGIMTRNWVRNTKATAAPPIATRGTGHAANQAYIHPIPQLLNIHCTHLYIHLSPTSGVADLANAVVVVISAADATLWIYLVREVPLADATKAILIGEGSTMLDWRRRGTRGRPRQEDRSMFCGLPCSADKRWASFRDVIRRLAT
ncbi:hypothetical protein GGP41_006293 [Bipolaris sorokiniana]|uniref:Uncharacterized protein n=1 Tax=Cochliobolus sativus TaxID=45130 RepID=A0A8H5ZHK5_COCSA|nr:hypothetical protein GGP41_006293 [Bipolaris sorokiniana]